MSRDRWDSRLSAEVWSRLSARRSLEGLDLPQIDGRLDLRGLRAPEPTEVARYQTSTSAILASSGYVELHGAVLENIDFSEAILPDLRLLNCRIANCRFEGAKCDGWRMWATTIEDCSFRAASLRRAVLGGVSQDGQRNHFRKLDFTKADLRQTVQGTAEFVECRFIDTKLSKVEFQGDVFVDCTFAGELKDVSFYRWEFQGEAFPPNELRGVDFTRARLRMVEFRQIDLDAASLPTDEEHIIINDYATVMNTLATTFDGRPDVGSRKLSAYFGARHKHAIPNQRRGVVNKLDLLDLAGPELVAEALAAIRTS